MSSAVAGSTADADGERHLREVRPKGVDGRLQRVEPVVDGTESTVDALFEASNLVSTAPNPALDACSRRSIRPSSLPSSRWIRPPTASKRRRIAWNCPRPTQNSAKPTTVTTTVLTTLLTRSIRILAGGGDRRRAA
jgi:hypothetical protein